MRALIFGGGGLVGTPLGQELASRGYRYRSLTHGDTDISDAKEVRAAIESYEPEVIFNCAAFTRVDDCETREEEATEVNGRALGHLVSAARSLSASLVHLSSDYVFDGRAESPYREGDPTAPLSAYGRGKQVGEQEALVYARSLVVRTSWIFGSAGPSFVRTILGLLDRPATLRIVDDQVGGPTYAPYLARALVDLVEAGVTGLVHYRNRDPVTWFEFARAIGARVEPGHEILPTTSAEFVQLAPRPSYSVLSVERFEKVTGRRVEAWSDGLRECLAAIGDRAGAS